VFFRLHPGPTGIDRWVQDSAWRRVGALAYVTDLGSRKALLVGSLVCALSAHRAGLRRMVVCGAGPLVAAGSAELVLKPAVGRVLQGVLTFPSGTVVVVSALATAAVLAARGRARPWVTGLGLLSAFSTALAVTLLQWHYPSDALAAVAWGSGVVLLLAGIVGGGAQLAAATVVSPGVSSGQWAASAGSPPNAGHRGL
jgi:hypothetical protein